MADADRCSLIREKLTLAGQLVRLSEDSGSPKTVVTGEALLQGTVALLAEARALLLKLVAESASDEAGDVDSLATLRARVGDQPGEVQVLSAAAADGNSWWSRLEVLLTRQQEPGRRASRPRDEALIAVAAAGPDCSPDALRSLISDFRDYFETFVERHDQW
ncbi:MULTISPECIES: DUF6586 family protein [Gammaproteobacteria]|uniref:Uncharacterized protein n=1 Tax=Vreelandella halophila TaxID=86177 RepID=A0A9X4YC75_9GAMM|nr:MULTISPECIES: DUF6586 family protein [Gammaproteobacteria]KAA8984274.1 hypothetical protein F3089_02645 [Halospina sp. K52047b]MYL27002.1 hypothetical protein [Halomonas utahensis]MYL75804.1 hypothetical protein [Halomonas sp. 22501_18_FS]